MREPICPHLLDARHSPGEIASDTFATIPCRVAASNQNGANVGGGVMVWRTARAAALGKLAVEAESPQARVQTCAPCVLHAAMPFAPGRT
jgi:hypothetical protein